MKTAPETTAHTRDGGDFLPDPRARLVGLLLALITVLVYLPAWFHGYICFDDPTYVSDNPIVQQGLSWTGLKWAFAGYHASNWHPLTWLSHQLDCQLFGLNPGAHHLVSVLFHAASAVLLYRLWLRLTGAIWPSAFVAALFAWHPLHVESVAWVAERKDVLSGVFFMLTLWAYARYVESKVQSHASRLTPHASRWYGLALAFFTLGLMSKPMLVSLPFVLLLLDYWPLQRVTGGKRWSAEGWGLVLEKGPFFLLAAVICVVTFLAQQQQAVLALPQYPLGARLQNAVVSYASYLFDTIWPAGLGAFYPLPGQFSAGKSVLSAAMLIVISLLAWRWRRHNRGFLTGWLWFLGMLVPVIGLVQVGEQAMADRYTYLPAVGLFVAAAFGLATGTRSNWPAVPATLAGVAILGACVAVTERQLSFWTDSETLFRRTLAVTKNNGPAHMLLGVAFEQRGRQEQALQQYQAAMACDAALIVQVAGGEKRPLAAQVQLLLGQSAEQAGKPAEALARYREALRLDANLVEAHNNLGNLLDGGGQPDEALAHYQVAVRLRPDLPVAHENLGTQLAKLGRLDEALREYREAARLAPADPQPLYLQGKAWLRRGQSQAAAAEFEAALRLDPEDCPSLTFLARIRAADQDPALRNGPLAVELAEKANTLTGGTQVLVLGTLAMAYGEAGRFDDARKTAQTALAFAAGGSRESLAALQAQLRGYESNQPAREVFTNSTP